MKTTFLSDQKRKRRNIVLSWMSVAFIWGVLAGMLIAVILIKRYTS